MTLSEIRPLRRMDEMTDAVALQRTYWGNDLESVIPAHMLFSLANGGGHVLAAFDRQKMIGVLVGFLGTLPDEPDRPAMANLQIVSKRMVVLPEYRGQGVGYHLKREQRRLALKQGIRLITWTFDPLLTLNAHLNIRKLGAISQTYYPDYYGTTSEGGLVTLGSSDRLLAEWWVTQYRVEEHMKGSRKVLSLTDYLDAATPITNLSSLNAAGLPEPPDNALIPAGSLALVEVPVDYGQLMRTDAHLAVRWRQHIRVLLQTLMQRRFIVTDFLREPYAGQPRAFYLLSQPESVFGGADFSYN